MEKLHQAGFSIDEVEIIHEDYELFATHWAQLVFPISFIWEVLSIYFGFYPR